MAAPEARPPAQDPLRAPRAALERRLLRPRLGPLGVRSTLRHFALITYAVPAARLAPWIPARFALQEFSIGGERRALLSAVPFLDEEFCFPRLAPFLRFRFGQTNHRTYVIDRWTGEPSAWFLGTTLGSLAVAIPRHLWKLPWHRARYTFDCRHVPARGAYERYAIAIDSEWCAATIELEDTGRPAPLLPGFATLDEQVLVLTHPVTGFFTRRDGRLGRYSIWHREMSLTEGRARRLHFGLHERLGLLGRDEMERPHSVLLCPEIEFDIHLPPRRLT